jgi:hypothetical protein
MEAERNDNIIPKAFFIEARRQLGEKNTFRIFRVRQWYCWAADHGYTGFCPEVAFEIEQMRIGGNEKGRAVLSLDPEEGPLDDLESTSLLNALRATRKSGRLSLSEQAATWICVAFGPNARQPALMREGDIKVFSGDDEQTPFIQADIPRMKKRGDSVRGEFRRRQLNWEIGNIILELIEENGERRKRHWPSTDFAFPLFVRDTPSEQANGPMREYAMHLAPEEFTRLVAESVKKLGVISHRTGEPLKITTRRLRYTYATRLVREGVSKREVADLLDHTDLQNVQVYFDIKSDIVAPLDKAIALALGPIAQAFLGKIVRNPSEATRGGDPSADVAVTDATSGSVRRVGTCGTYSFCGLMAPVACYTCISFQPWIDGPHHLALEKLLAERERKVVAGRDGRMVGIHDITILAIGDVITRIEAMKKGAK